MNGRSIPVGQFLALMALLIFLAGLPGASQADDAAYSSVLPIIMAPPGVLIVDDEESLRAAVEIANRTGQFPRIEITADIGLGAPLPVLENPRAGTAIIAGNGHTLDGNQVGSVLAIGAETRAVIERLIITDGSGSDVCGGGIYSEGELTLRQSHVVGNWARHGGGICVLSPQSATALLTLEDSTVSDNHATITGGGIYANGNLMVNINDSLLQANSARESGGAILAYAGSNQWLELTVENSTLSGNRADTFVGGAIFSATYDGYITTYINHSTIAFNSAPEGGGLSNQGSFFSHGQADAIIKNSTFSANVSSGKGGAISNVDNLLLLLGAVRDERASDDPAPQGGIGGANIKLLFSTVSGNQAAQGSGIWNGGQAYLQSTGSIIADNEESGRDCWQGIVSRGYNLDSDGSCGLDEPTDLANGQAGLRPLALVPPGSTATHALGPDSEALDRIPAGEIGCGTAIDTDQRGVARPQPVGGMCDMGAYEVDE